MSGAELPMGRAVAVVPRGHRPRGEASLPIDQLLLPVIRGGVKGVVQIIGPPGGGKSSALRYLREVLPADTRVKFFDVNQTTEAHEAGAEGVSVLAAVGPDPGERFLDVIAISPWTMDDCLEYLAVVHREWCGSVMSRLGKDGSVSLMKGSPQLLTVVMDAMAGDEGLISSREILRDFLAGVMPRGLGLERLILDGPIYVPLSGVQGKWWRHERVQNICRAEWVADQVCGGIVPLLLERMDEIGHLIADIAAVLRGRTEAIEFLEKWVYEHRRVPGASAVVSILLGVDGNWRLPEGGEWNLCRAQLAGARWAGVDLTGALLFRADLKGTDLEGAKLVYAKGPGADLSGAKLCGASMQNTSWVGADFSGADLSKAVASKADFSEANLESANLEEGDFHKSGFWRANLSDVRGWSSNFCGAQLGEAIVEQANFSGAGFREARLDRVDMSPADWNRASFALAKLRHCNLEGLEILMAKFDEADLTGCLLTGSRMPGGSFRGANLTRTGLADIEWENADLCDANFKDASFHMGSTRSGMVGSLIPCEGSKTGFYTDEFNEQLYKSPEEIRKANLCGANLIGAKVEGTDFYLVDLRRASYSKKQAMHFSKSGAILRAVM